MIFNTLNAHEGHELVELATFSFKSIGELHPILIHFPIALIFMTVLAEILRYFTENQLFNSAARFMIVAAAIFVVPTVFTGFIFSLGADYPPNEEMIFHWHRTFGILTLGLTILAAFLKEYEYEKGYFVILALAFISVSIGAGLGGELTWGFF